MLLVVFARPKNGGGCFPAPLLAIKGTEEKVFDVPEQTQDLVLKFP
jgi:hypothetical protein